MSKNYHLNYFKSISDSLSNSVYYHKGARSNDIEILESINNKMISLCQQKNRIFFLGNGASAAFANHMALDFSKNGKILARSLSDSAMLTALANDYSYESAMTEYLKVEDVTASDLIITVSSSGNSPNIVKALNHCRDNGIQTLALSGLKMDNQSVLLADHSIYVPAKTYGIVECVHQIFLHMILDRFMCIYEWDREDYQNMSADKFKL